MTASPGAIYDLCVTDDSKYVVTASADSTARVWTVEDGVLRQTLQGHTGLVLSAAVSRDGTRVVTSSYDQTARIWSLQTGELLQARQVTVL